MLRRVPVLANFTARQVAISRSGSKGVCLLNKELSFTYARAPRIAYHVANAFCANCNTHVCTHFEIPQSEQASVRNGPRACHKRVPTYLPK